MLFHSYIYLILFLPIAVLGYRWLSVRSVRLAMYWLIGLSLVFYASWYPEGRSSLDVSHVFLLLGSCLGNYALGKWLSRWQGQRLRNVILILSVASNLLLLGYYKYTAFILKNINEWFTSVGDVPKIILPLAISFYTFLQIAYLVDAYRGKTKDHGFGDYLLFVTFFPHLIAGPLVHHGEMMPQFSQQKSKVKFRADLSIGLTMLVVGLFKKVVIADDLAEFANPIFSTVYQTGVAPDTVDAWVGMLSYGLQLYFDFSGYSDMAIGSARLFGIRFPMNFNSPYQATSIVDFWRRWHMTLSRFLRDYLYIAMGGGRVAQWRRYMNLMLTMALGGIWHGAGWNFLIWGLVHGLLLCVNHFWDQFNRAYLRVKMPRVIATGMTLLVVMMLWVIFRAPDLGTAMRMLGALWTFDFDHVQMSKAALVTIALGLIVVWALPNTQQWMSRYGPCIESLRKDPAQHGGRRWWHWRPTKGWALAVCLAAFAVAIKLDRISEFIYFQF